MTDHAVRDVDPQEDGNPSTSRPSYTSLGHIPKGHFILPQRHLLNHVYSRISVVSASSQITTQSLIVNYKCLVNSSGLLLTSSYNLSGPIFHIYTLPFGGIFLKHGIFISCLPLCLVGISAPLLPSILSFRLSHLTSS